MANRFPIIYNPNANQLQEMASGDNLDLSGNNIINLVGIGVTNINVVGIITSSLYVGTSASLTTLSGTQVSYTNASIGVGTITTLDFGTNAEQTTTSTNVSTTSATAIDTFSTTLFRSARVQVQITQGTNYQASDVLIIHNGSTADIVEYGSIATNDYLGTFSAAVSGGNCLLRINMGSATAATVKTISQRITV